jgi:hypothetical protein
MFDELKADLIKTAPKPERFTNMTYENDVKPHV